MAVPDPQSGPPHRGSQPPLAHPSTLNYSNLPPAHTEKVRSALPLTGAFWVGTLGGTFLALSGASLAKGPFVRSDEFAFLSSLVVNAAWTATFCTVPFGLTLKSRAFPLDRRTIRRPWRLAMLAGAMDPVFATGFILLGKFAAEPAILGLCGVLVSLVVYPAFFAIWIGSRAE